MSPLDRTHDAAARSWLDAANDAATPFPIQNLPLSVFRRVGSDEALRGGVAIGDQVLDLGALAASRCLGTDVQAVLDACAQPGLNDFLALGQTSWLTLGEVDRIRCSGPGRDPSLRSG